MGNTKENYLREFYELCMAKRWDYYALLPFEEHYSLEVYSIMKNAERYMKVFLKESAKEFEEQIDFAKKKRKIKLSVPNPVLKKEKGLDAVYYLWRTDEEKKIVLEYCYEYLLRINWQEDAILKFAQEFGFSSSSKIKWLAEQYAYEYLHMTESEFLKIKWIAREENKYYKQICQRLEKETDIDAINEILSDPSLDINYLRSAIYNYVIFFREEQKDFLIAELRNKITVARKQKRDTEKGELKKLNQQLNVEKAKNAVKDFVHGKYKSIEDFCNFKKITKSEFLAYLEIVREYVPELYEQYKTFQNARHARLFAIYICRYKAIAETIITGVEENGVIYPFDIIDYHRMTNTDLKTFSNVVPDLGLSSQKFAVVSKFLQKYEKITPLSRQEVLNMKTVIHLKKDEQGNYIPNSGHVVTESEKLGLLNFLLVHHVPLNNQTYMCALRRFQNNRLCLDDSPPELKLK